MFYSYYTIRNNIYKQVIFGIYHYKKYRPKKPVFSEPI